MLFLKRLGVTINGVGRSLYPWLLNSFCIVFNLSEHNPYLDLTYALLKAVGGHHQWRWMEPSSLATEQFCIVFNLSEHNPYLDLTYALLKAVGGHHQWR